MKEENTPQTLGDLDNLIEKREAAVKTKSVWPLGFLSTVLPPFGLILAIIIAIKSERLHFFLPVAVIIHSLFLFLLAGTMYGLSSVIETINSIEAIEGANVNVSSNIIILAIIVGILEFSIGLIYRRKSVRDGFLARMHMTVLFLLLVVNLVIVPVIITKIFSAI